MTLMIELVKRLVLNNKVRDEIVECPECGNEIKANDKKTVAGKFVRHDPCHQFWRHDQRYQTAHDGSGAQRIN